MKASPSTSPSEQSFRDALLFVLHSQWRTLGVPFQSALQAPDREVVDPEALIWCSLEFFDQEPRLAEGVRSWVIANRSRINRQRLTNLARTSTEESRRSHLLELLGRQRRPSREDRNEIWPAAKGLGAQSPGPSTLFLRTRDVLGNDCRSFLIVYLLGNERGIRLRDVSKWTGYWYRSISEAASGWERAEVVRIEHGYCVLTKPSPWRELLAWQEEPFASLFATIDWLSAFQSSIELLRTFAKARENGFATDHPLVVSAIRRTSAALFEAAGGLDPSRTPTLNFIHTALSG